jgi:hypothetical protein
MGIGYRIERFACFKVASFNVTVVAGKLPGNLGNFETSTLRIREAGAPKASLWC